MPSNCGSSFGTVKTVGRNLHLAAKGTFVLLFVSIQNTGRVVVFDVPVGTVPARLGLQTGYRGEAEATVSLAGR